jgi:hypothetical protein
MLLKVWKHKVCASCHADSAFWSVLMFFLFPHKWCNIAMNGTSAINILYQYPLWSLSQSAEMTFVIFLFCWYRIWRFHGMCVLILLMYRTRYWPTCVFVFCVCFTERICSAKICLAVRKCVSMKYDVWIHAEFQTWLRKQDELLFKTHFLELFKYVVFRWNDQIWQFYNITGMLKFL